MNIDIPILQIVQKAYFNSVPYCSERAVLVINLDLRVTRHHNQVVHGFFSLRIQIQRHNLVLLINQFMRLSLITVFCVFFVEVEPGSTQICSSEGAGFRHDEIGHLAAFLHRAGVFDKQFFRHETVIAEDGGDAYG